ncbi:hypothetical protein CVT26_005366 [Gymnopilus dilepis]|uniref:DUF292-domain-containing protein n=1 Tax=Gymnopilus dilepis TaxID=231916 RepID=A0A409YT11_9AGAR|nr:hypothetical protein CVT26_005366 [Gymnopilus dilepis]
MSMWNATKAKRLRTLQQKKEAQAKASRREIATLLERGRIETARIKVETLINEDIYVELLELLELYCELLVARFGLLDQNTREPDPGVAEGVCSIIHAAPRTELKELHILRDILMHKYGRDFSLSVMENRDGCVSPRVMSKLTVGTPAPALVDAYLREIAKAYGVPWTDPEAQPDDSSEGQEKSEAALEASERTGEEKSKGSETPSVPPESSKPSSDVKGASSPPVEDEFELLSKRFAALKKR